MDFFVILALAEAALILILVFGLLDLSQQLDDERDSKRHLELSGASSRDGVERLMDAASGARMQ